MRDAETALGDPGDLGWEPTDDPIRELDQRIDDLDEAFAGTLSRLFAEIRVLEGNVKRLMEEADQSRTSLREVEKRLGLPRGFLVPERPMTTDLGGAPVPDARFELEEVPF